MTSCLEQNPRAVCHLALDQGPDGGGLLGP